MWIRKILYELGLLKEQCPTLILIDNQPAIGLAKHKMIKQRTKHIQLKYDWIKEQIENKVLNVNYINTKENLADFFTKKNVSRIGGGHPPVKNGNLLFSKF